jgi:hypothetical protein
MTVIFNLTSVLEIERRERSTPHLGRRVEAGSLEILLNSPK